MTEQLAIFSPAIAPKTYDGQRVMTLRDIDEIHKRPEGTAKRNFRENKNHFVEGVDYYLVTNDQKDENRPFENGKVYQFEIGKRGTYVFTLTGYLMIVKSFTDDLSWAIQRELVTGYFSGRKRGKTFMGTPVCTIVEYCESTGESRGTVKHRIKTHYGKDFPMGSILLLEGTNLRIFREENPEAVNATRGPLYIITQEGAKHLMAMARRRAALPI